MRLKGYHVAVKKRGENQQQHRSIQQQQLNTREASELFFWV